MSKRRFRVEWRHVQQAWCDVMAENEEDAIKQAKADNRIFDTTDSDPVHDDWKKAKATEVKL